MSRANSDYEETMMFDIETGTDSRPQSALPYRNFSNNYGRDLDAVAEQFSRELDYMDLEELKRELGEEPETDAEAEELPAEPAIHAYNADFRAFRDETRPVRAYNRDYRRAERAGDVDQYRDLEEEQPGDTSNALDKAYLAAILTVFAGILVSVAWLALEILL